ncbi:bifunctional phosphoribosylaminoimidazolecarboxamide formyltransferase/IMP cyclohydrolase [Parvularcula sp. ZS-1/3]|uniref:Bifunctional purine biosynthesis protein PurH n=1 Tax=Parvularcula mediterranea TaxID=2732508 RepID=A0A7Y3W569_9PROT|nr:bifunctional phosphoribosylaminoimidazolecarboxamide formyltransferase/IMP cyclohydrolase [Parvularcula mediterranea]NNU16490.1 bifunctional phosphoribosylaminoimidazolecarboxamide formyltransferase/IMP cyclohydrolase [Parvularcula mediterranea]
MTARFMPRRALLSVSDKNGLIPFAEKLASHGVTLLSTGGTAKALREAGLEVTDVSKVTGFPEIMDGRVKTLHPSVHGGLLGREGTDDAAMEEHGIAPIDLLVVNLYPFEESVRKGADEAGLVETIDIGGPAMIRASAKNFERVTVITDPEDYAPLLDELSAGGTTKAFRKQQSSIAYGRTAQYDLLISQQLHEGDAPPRRTGTVGRIAQTLRYGENPHQSSAAYRTAEERAGVLNAEQHQGKELSYNNLNDTDAAVELAAELRDEAAVVIVKHANPCGVAQGQSIADAYKRALRCDPVSAFGGIIAATQRIDRQAAEEITKIFTEVVIAPGVDEDAKELFAKKKNLRLLTIPELPDPAQLRQILKPIAGGFLHQDHDTALFGGELKTVTKRAPSEQELADLRFAFTVAKHVKSNAIVYAKDGATVGIGAGQMSRLDSSRIAARKSQDAAEAEGLSEALVKGSVVASDAFFPFADGLLAAADAGATAVIQPGGSMRDDEVIAAADDAGLAMVFTGMRHFRH